MQSLPTTFGLLHLPTKRFARFDSVDRAVFHRLNSHLSQATYRDKDDELTDRAKFYEAEQLSTVLEILRAKPDRFGSVKIDDGYARIDIYHDLSEFSPVAFLREASRLGGTGDYVGLGIKVKLVINADELGDVYELTDIPT